MAPNLRRLRDRLRGRLVSITDWFTGLRVTIQPEAPDFMSQRMCPFCGLITSRHKSFCLECGKSLKPA